jgi:hypothetical protein
LELNKDMLGFNHIKWFGFVFVIGMTGMECGKPCPDDDGCPPEPQIELDSLYYSSKNEEYVDDPTIDQRPWDSIFIVLNFKDGDGDLGGKADNNSDEYIVDQETDCVIGHVEEVQDPKESPLDTVKANAFVVDQRTNCTQHYTVPHIPQKSRVKAISGEIEITKLSDACRQLPPGRKFDTVSYVVYIQDRAGNISNKVATPSIVIRCRK